MRPPCVTVFRWLWCETVASMKRWWYVLLMTWPDGSERVMSYPRRRYWTRKGAEIAAECEAETIRDMEEDLPPYRFEVQRVPAYL